MGVRIKEAREALGFSQDDLAEILKMKRANISNYEAGRATPPSDVLRDLAQALKLSTDFILDVGQQGVGSRFSGVVEIGGMVKEERQSAGLTQQQLANLVGISQTEVSQFERDILSIPPEVFEKIVSVFGMSTAAFLDKHNLFDDYIPPHFDGDVDAYVAFKEAEFEDGMSERAQNSYTLAPKDERDIARDLECIMNDLESNEALAFYGERVEFDDEAKELLRASLEQSMRLAKKMSKRK